VGWENLHEITQPERSAIDAGQTRKDLFGSVQGLILCPEEVFQIVRQQTPGPHRLYDLMSNQVLGGRPMRLDMAGETSQKPGISF